MKTFFSPTRTKRNLVWSWVQGVSTMQKLVAAAFLWGMVMIPSSVHASVSGSIGGVSYSSSGAVLTAQSSPFGWAFAQAYGTGGVCDWAPGYPGYPTTPHLNDAGACLNQSLSNQFSSGVKTFDLVSLGAVPGNWFWLYQANIGHADLMYFCANGADLEYSSSSCAPSDTTPRLIDWNPADGSTTPSTSVYFSADVYSTASSTVTFDIWNYDTVDHRVIELPIQTLGASTVSTTTTLLQGYYSSSVTFSQPSTNLYDFHTFGFTVLSTNTGRTSYASSTAAAADLNATCIGTSTSAFFYPLINFGCFLVVPSATAINQFSNLTTAIKTKIPFAYYYDIKNIVASSSANAASSTLGTFTLNIGTSTDPFHVSTVIFSPTTIRYFVTSSLATAFSLVVSASVWLGFAWYMYKRITGLLAHKTK